MATASQQNQVQSASTPSASASSDPASLQDELSWEGDRMFNIYIWDYCVKRGYSNTARELAEEAKLNPNPRPPIDAKQGLLYEWWSVFWVLFSAKSSNSGSDDAMVYIQNHMAQARMHQVSGAMPRYPNGLRALPGASGAIPTIPNSLGAGAPPHPGHPGQPPNAHPMPNGIGPSPPGPQQSGQPQVHGPHTQQAPSHQQPPQAPPPLGFPAHVQQQPQPNGMPAHVRPSMPGQGQPGPGAGPGTGQPGRQMPFYQSPTMAPQQPGSTAGPPPPYPGPGPLTGGGMAPNLYQQQHLRGMLPPGVPNGIGGVAGSPGFPPGSGSRTPTPAQPTGGGITHPSPSMTHRSVPVTPPNFGGPSGMAVPGGRGPPFDQVNQMNAEIQKIDPATMNEIRQELGLGNKDFSILSFDDKTRVVNAFKQRNAPGPSNSTRAQPGRPTKRNSVSPGDGHAEIPMKSESSPPAQKRVRRSPEQPTPPAPGPAGTASQGGPSSNANQNPMSGMYAQSILPNGMRPGGQPFPPQMNAMGMGQGSPGMMMHPGGHPGMVNQQMQQFKNPNSPYHPNMQGMHNKMGTSGMPIPSSIPVSSSGDNLSNISSDPQQMQQPFGPDPNQPRPGQPFPPGQRTVGGGKMLPPSSPASSANASGQGKPPQGGQAKGEGVKVENSPRGGGPVPPPSGGSTGPSPPTPVPSAAQVGQSAPSPSLTNQSRPTTSTSNPPTSTASGGPPPSVPAPPASAPPAPPASAADGNNFEFMLTGFDDFTSMFGREESLDFERDFGSWFNGDITGVPDLTK